MATVGPIDWRDRSACRDAPPELFELRRANQTGADVRRVYCNACPVRVVCRDDARAQTDPPARGVVAGGGWFDTRGKETTYEQAMINEGISA